MAISAHLFRQPSGIYVFRVVIPKDLRGAVGLTEFRRSLRTRELSAARRIAYHLALRVFALIDEVRLVGMDDEKRKMLASLNPLIGSGFEVDFHPSGRFRVTSDPNNPQDGEQALRALQFLTSQFRQPVAGESPPPVSPPLNVGTVALPKKTDDDLIKQYLALNAGKWAAGTLQEYRGALERFKGYLGRRHLGGVRPSDISDYLQHMQDSHRERTGKEVSEYTLDKSIKALSGLYKYLQKIEAFPAGKLPTEAFGLRKRDRRRLARVAGFQKFSPDDLKRIFDPAAYRVLTLPHEFWFPLLGLLTLARIEEIAQALVSDIRPYGTEGKMLFAISREGSHKNLKSDAAERDIPIMDVLVHCGFLEYVSDVEARYGKDSRLFPYLRVDSRKKFSDVPSEFFARHKKNVGIEEAKKVFHSFRETGNQRLTNNKTPDSVLDHILGHSTKSTRMAHYTGDGHPMENILHWMCEALAYPEINFGALKYDRESMLVALEKQVARRKRMDSHSQARQRRHEAK